LDEHEAHENQLAAARHHEYRGSLCWSEGAVNQHGTDQGNQYAPAANDHLCDRTLQAAAKLAIERGLGCQGGKKHRAGKGP